MAEHTLSGDRFTVRYEISGDADLAHAKAVDICYEQTVEFPADLTPGGYIQDFVGQIQDKREVGPEHHLVTISFPCEAAGDELTQFLNVLFGNTSIKPGVRVERFDLPPRMLSGYRGPRYGRDGLRELLAAPARPLLCTALKPMGLHPEELASQAYRFASGGIDIIKDDHGITNQTFAPFKERVKRCAEAVLAANAKTGYRSIYMPNVTASHDQLVERAYTAKGLGAGGLLVAPGLTGFDAMRRLADDDSLALPVMSHPTFLGSFTTSRESGISPFALYGQIIRLAGADATIFTSWGGRFAFSREDCVAIVQALQETMGSLKPSFPTPGGGMTMERVPEMMSVYGRDVIFLMGGGLHRHSPDLVVNSSYFRDIVEKMG